MVMNEPPVLCSLMTGENNRVFITTGHLCDTNAGFKGKINLQKFGKLLGHLNLVKDI